MRLTRVKFCFSGKKKMMPKFHALLWMNLEITVAGAPTSPL